MSDNTNDDTGAEPTPQPGPTPDPNAQPISTPVTQAVSSLGQTVEDAVSGAAQKHQYDILNAARRGDPQALHDLTQHVMGQVVGSVVGPEAAAVGEEVAPWFQKAEAAKQPGAVVSGDNVFAPTPANEGLRSVTAQSPTSPVIKSGPNSWALTDKPGWANKAGAVTTPGQRARMEQLGKKPMADGGVATPDLTPDPTNLAALQGGTPQLQGPSIANTISEESQDNAAHGPTTPVFDISGEQPVLGDLPHAEVHDAVASGKFSLPKGTSVPVFAPDGTLGSIDASEAPESFRNGYTYATPEAIDNHMYGSGGEQAATVAEGLGRGLVGPLATGAEHLLGVPGKDIRGRERTNPWSSGLGEAAGLVGGAVTGTGEAALLGHLGEGAVDAARGAELLGPKSASLLSKIGARSISDAAQMVAYQGGDEVSKLINGDPNQSAGSALSNMALSGVLGGAVGGVLGAISPLWKATVGSKVGQAVSDFKGTWDNLIKNPDAVEAATKELGDFQRNIDAGGSEIYGANGLKAEAIRNNVPEMHQGIVDQVDTLGQKLDKTVQKLGDDPLAPRMSRAVDEWKEAVSPTRDSLTNQATKTPTPGDIFDATEKLKKQLQAEGKFNQAIHPIGEKDYRNAAAAISHDLRTSLEDPEVWGKAGQVQRDVNSAYVAHKRPDEQFKSMLMREIDGVPQMDPGKVSTLINQLDKPQGVLKRKILENYFESSGKLTGALDDAHASINSESPIQPSSLSFVKSLLQKPSAGTKLARYLFNSGVNHLAGESLGTSIGAGVGHLVGAPGIGAMIGERALTPVFKSVLPAMVKPFMEGPLSSPGAKAAIEYGIAVAKGEAEMSKAVKGIFKAPGEAASASHFETPSADDRAKLDAKLVKIQQKPETLTQTNGDLGHYLPQHAAAMAAAVTASVGYLNSLRPTQASSLPLDGKMPPNPVAQAKYENALNIAEKPTIVLGKIAKGTLTSQDMQHLAAINPGAYKSMKTKVMNEVMEQKAKGNIIPYRTKMAISTFIGQPLDSTMTPTGISGAQPQSPQAQPQTATQPASNPKRSTSKLGGIAKQSQTQSQARQARSDK